MAGRSTSRSARRWTHRRRPSSPRSRNPTASGGTHRASGRRRYARPPADGSSDGSKWPSTRRRSGQQWAARSSSAPCPNGCGCGRPIATPSSTRRRRIPPTRWAPSSPAAGRWRSPSMHPAAWPWTPSATTTPPVRWRCGSTARATRRAPWRTSGSSPSGDGVARSPCSPTSATWSSPGSVRAAASCSTAHLAWSPCTRSPSGPTSPARGSGSTPATVSSCATSRKFASTSG